MPYLKGPGGQEAYNVPVITEEDRLLAAKVILGSANDLDDAMFLLASVGIDNDELELLRTR